MHVLGPSPLIKVAILYMDILGSSPLMKVAILYMDVLGQLPLMKVAIHSQALFPVCIGLYNLVSWSRIHTQGKTSPREPDHELGQG